MEISSLIRSLLNRRLYHRASSQFTEVGLGITKIKKLLI